MSNEKQELVEEFNFELNKYYAIYSYDHYSTDEIMEAHCIMFTTGLCKKIDELYVSLVHIKADVGMKDSAIEVHTVFIPAIVAIEELKSEIILINGNFKLENLKKMDEEDSEEI